MRGKAKKESRMIEFAKAALVVSNLVVCAIAVRLAWLDVRASSKVKRAKHARSAGDERCGDGDGQLNP